MENKGTKKVPEKYKQKKATINIKRIKIRGGDNKRQTGILYTGKKIK